MGDDSAAAAKNAARAHFIFVCCSLVVGGFVLYALPLAMLGRSFASLGVTAYRVAFAAALAAHANRLLYTLRPKMEGKSVPQLQAAAPALAREALGSNALLVCAQRACLAHAGARATAAARRGRTLALRLAPTGAAPAEAARLSRLALAGARVVHSRLARPCCSLCCAPARRAQYCLYCLLFLLSRPTPLALLPVAFTAFAQVSTHLRKNPPPWPAYAAYGPKLDDLLNANLPLALGMCANAQVMIGITLIIGLATRQREVVCAAGLAHGLVRARALTRRCVPRRAPTRRRHSSISTWCFAASIMPTTT